MIPWAAFEGRTPRKSVGATYAFSQSPLYHASCSFLGRILWGSFDPFPKPSANDRRSCTMHGTPPPVNRRNKDRVAEFLV
jgi:hypothetical protein